MLNKRMKKKRIRRKFKVYQNSRNGQRSLFISRKDKELKKLLDGKEFIEACFE